MERQKFYLYFVICLLLFTEIPLVAAQGEFIFMFFSSNTFMSLCEQATSLVHSSPLKLFTYMTVMAYPVWLTRRTLYHL